MSYTITTVAETLGRINKGLYIPGIQRPYVWTQEQIIRLFDSLMRKYPIGTLLLWDLPSQSRGDWEVYRFVENFWEGDIHNDQIELAPDERCTLVLDGQQRLTSLLIGLKGTYVIRQKRRRRNNADAWDEVALHINLAHAPEGDDEVDDEDSPLAEHYQFAFFDVQQRPKNAQDELWFELSFILSAEDESELERISNSWIDNNTHLDEKQKNVARANLIRLWEMVWRDQAIAYFTEFSNSYDRVLDIFIRANDGGTRLSRSDLLMSVITLRWEQFNAREETEELIKELTDLLQPKRSIQREFLLRSALFLNNLNFTIQVKNFTPSNISRLEETWNEVKHSLVFTANWLRSVGLYGEALSGINIAMLLSYFFRHVGISRGEAELTETNAERIRQWVITLQFQRLLSLQINSTLNDFRTMVRRLPSGVTEFPVLEAARMFSRNGRQFGFNAEWVNKLCDLEMGSVESEKLLSLMYGRDLAASRLRPVPLVQSRYFMPEELRRAGIPEALHPSLQHHANRLGIALALTEEEAIHYYELPFDRWVQTLRPDQVERHHLPPEIIRYGIADLPAIIQLRRQRIASHLSSAMPEVRDAVIS
jgi:uncharacterized protein with ParB-like and HNH nuclease domain